ncbi:uncharacterized protein BX664DRAFT_389391 [Halteromyces radiatus]|uniref:uncharacterized protein n=1 Tax=Halteromyces radiatus TaxID=101107 RepID=UPI00221FCD89|nr:uncharacterized protein BX664DRAFT_389391 [Halteromyces radiatus]KAI8077797.1 hypothetical protein BX664DRAFT_389391 [Halteromyces radiatus]
MLTSRISTTVPEGYSTVTTTNTMTTSTRKDISRPQRQAKRKRYSTIPTRRMLTRKTTSLTTTPINTAANNDSIPTPQSPLEEEQEEEEVSIAHTLNDNNDNNDDDTKQETDISPSTTLVVSPEETTLHSNDDDEDEDKGENEISMQKMQMMPICPVPITTLETKDDNDQVNDDDPFQRQAALKDLTYIEVHFARLRQKVFEEKLEDLYQEILMVENGTHPEQLEMMQHVDNKKINRIKKATAKRDIRLLSYRKQFESTIHQANHDFMARRQHLKMEIEQKVGHRRFKLNDERMNITTDTLSENAHDLRQKRMVVSEQLHHIKQYNGFPRAPSAPGLSDQEMLNDLMEMKPILEDVGSSRSSSTHSMSSLSTHTSPPMMLSTSSTPLSIHPPPLTYHQQATHYAIQDSTPLTMTTTRQPMMKEMPMINICQDRNTLV